MGVPRRGVDARRGRGRLRRLSRLCRLRGCDGDIPYLIILVMTTANRAMLTPTSIRMLKRLIRNLAACAPGPSMISVLSSVPRAPRICPPYSTRRTPRLRRVSEQCRGPGLRSSRIRFLVSPVHIYICFTRARVWRIGAIFLKGEPQHYFALLFLCR